MIEKYGDNMLALEIVELVSVYAQQGLAVDHIHRTSLGRITLNKMIGVNPSSGSEIGKTFAVFVHAGFDNLIVRQWIVAGQSDNMIKFELLCNSTKAMKDILFASAQVRNSMVPTKCLYVIIQRVFCGSDHDFSTQVESLQHIDLEQKHRLATEFHQDFSGQPG